MAKLYDIAEDLLSLNDLIESLVDENGEPREPTEEEMQEMKKWFEVTYEELQNKFDSYCKFIKNLKLSSENADSERKNMKDELDRLAKRAKARENQRNAVQGLLRWNLERLGIKTFKSDLFTANIQNGQKQVSLASTAKIEDIPAEYLKPRELDTVAVKDALKDGVLIQKEGAENYGKVFTREGVEIKGLMVIQGTNFIIR
jgi:predicted RNase H-like nuclease (RuvC/YqgF family)